MKRQDDLYFILNPALGIIKIGIAGDVETRRMQLECGTGVPLVVLRVVEGGAPYERALHDTFGRDRLLGEWFEPTDEIYRLATSGDSIADVVEAKADATRAWLKEREAGKEQRRAEAAAAQRAEREEIARIRAEEARLKALRAEKAKKAQEAAGRRRRERQEAERKEMIAERKEMAVRQYAGKTGLLVQEAAKIAASRRGAVEQRSRNAALLGLRRPEVDVTALEISQ